MGPEPTAQERLVVADGLALQVDRFVPEGRAPRALVVFAHGFSSHSALYRHVAGALTAVGMMVVAFDARGHGRSPGRRGYVRRFADFDDDLARVIALGRESLPAGPLALVTHSHGALVAIDALLAGRASADLLVAAAPYLGLRLRVPAWKLALSHVLDLLWPTLALGNELRPTDVSRNPEVLAGWNADPLVHHVATARWFNQARDAQARVLAGAAGLRLPVFMPLGADDRVVDNAVAHSFARAAGPHVEVKEYPSLYHELFLEPEREVVIADMVAWLDGRLPR